MAVKKVNLEDFYRMVDLNNDGFIDLAEMEEVCKIFSDFSRKELHMIHMFMDIDKNNKVDRQEFFAQMKKAQHKYGA